MAVEGCPRIEHHKSVFQQMAKRATKNFILRMDADMMNAIEAWAADEFRSTNGQLQWIIAEALRKAGRMPARHGSESGG